jgi:hypothetical protein
VYSWIRQFQTGLKDPHSAPAPFRALLESLRRFQWTVTSPTTFRTATGYDVDATLVTPAAIRHHLTRDFIELKIAEFDKHNKAGYTVDWHMVFRALCSCTWTLGAKKALLQLASGQELTRTWAHQRGYSCGDACPCGQGLDTFEHRLTGCPHCPRDTQAAEDSMVDVHKALTFHVAPAHDEYTGIICRVNGDSVSEDGFRWDPALPVFTDGSCKYVTDPHLAISVAAAVQVTS